MNNYQIGKMLPKGCEKVKNSAKKFMCLSLVFVLIFSLCSCGEKEDAGNTSEFYAMDTLVDVTLKGDGAEDALSQIETLVNDLDINYLSRTSTTSNISKLNRGKVFTLDPLLVGYFTTLVMINNQSGGAFNFTMGKLSDLWGFTDENPSVPDDADIKDLANECNNGSVMFDSETNNIYFSSSGLSLDMGAVGKGIALDEIKKQVLDGSTLTECVAAVGGSVIVWGERDFTVGIKDPNSAGYIATLTLPACCVSTSGNYERYFEEDGKRYHHILDPETGYPVDNGLASVTIVAESGTVSDALSTACFVLGIEEGMALCEKFGVEAIFVTEEKEIHTSAATAEHLEINDSSYTLVITDEK